MNATPLMITIALHYLTEKTDYSPLDHVSQPVRQALNELSAAGLIESRPGAMLAYHATDGLRVWVEALCEVPLPVRRWVIPEEARPEPREVHGAGVVMDVARLYRA
jgi:hypothetical protein